MTHEEVPLAAIFRELLGLLWERPDAVLFGAHAVNAYCEPARMTQALDVLTTEPDAFAEAARLRLSEQLHIAVRVRAVAAGQGVRVYQLRKPKNRHLLDVRGTDVLPPHRVIEGVQVIEPEALVAMKADAVVARAAREKGLSHRLDLARLLRTFPDLRDEQRMQEIAARCGTSERGIDVWREIARTPLAVDLDDDGDDEQ